MDLGLGNVAGRKSRWAGAGAILFTLPFCGVGVFAFVAMLVSLAQGNWKQAAFFSIFALTFGGVGFGLLSVILAGIARQKQENRLREKYPDKPWMWKKTWVTGKMDCSSKTTMISVWAFAILWNAITLPAVFAIPGEISRKGNYLILIALIFPLAGLWLITWAVQTTIRFRKFGRSIFQMASMPGVIGGTIGGVIHCGVDIAPEDGFHLKLACINRVTTGSGKSRSTHEHTLWSAEETLARELFEADKRRTAIPVYFQIPYDCRASDVEPSDNYILWRLQAKAKVPGVDYEAAFEPPVFKTEASVKNLVADEDPLAAFRAKQSLRDSLLAAGVEKKFSSHGGVAFEYLPWRTWTTGLVVFIIVAALAGLTVALAMSKTPWFAPVISGIFAVLFALAGGSYWFPIRRIVIENQALRIERQGWGMRSAREIACADVAGFEARPGVASGAQQYYDLYLRRKNGALIAIGRKFEDERRAQKLADAIQEAISSGAAPGRPANASDLAAQS